MQATTFFSFKLILTLWCSHRPTQGYLCDGTSLYLMRNQHWADWRLGHSTLWSYTVPHMCANLTWVFFCLFVFCCSCIKGNTTANYYKATNMSLAIFLCFAHRNSGCCCSYRVGEWIVHSSNYTKAFNLWPRERDRSY